MRYANKILKSLYLADELINKEKTLFLVYLLVLTVFSSCNKWADVPPPTTSTTGGSAFQENATAVAVLSGVYASMSSGDISSGRNGISIIAGLSSDEFTLMSPAGNPNLELFYTNNLSAQQNVGIWMRAYYYLHTINSALEGISASESLTPHVKSQLLGEAKFMRAFLHFYLTNFYGDVPLCLSSDYKSNAIISRSNTQQVIQQVKDDLQSAKTLLSEDFLSSDGKTATVDRVRPTKWAASALLARVCLYNKEWENAEAEATYIINNTSRFTLVDLPEVFLMNNMEAIWQLMPVDQGYNTWDARVFIPVNGFQDAYPIALSDTLVNSFEAGDERKLTWTKEEIASGKLYPYKYKVGEEVPFPQEITEYLVVFRLAEQYLVRAEARIQRGNIVDGVADLNVIRQRANRLSAVSLPIIPSTVLKEQALKSVEQERKIELFSEWGHRWFDLKRMDGFDNPSTKRVDEIMPIISLSKGGDWQTTDQLYPLPFEDIRLNPNLGPQNLGY